MVRAISNPADCRAFTTSLRLFICPAKANPCKPLLIASAASCEPLGRSFAVVNACRLAGSSGSVNPCVRFELFAMRPRGLCLIRGKGLQAFSCGQLDIGNHKIQLKRPLSRCSTHRQLYWLASSPAKMHSSKLSISSRFFSSLMLVSSKLRQPDVYFWHIGCRQ